MKRKASSFLNIYSLGNFQLFTPEPSSIPYVIHPDLGQLVQSGRTAINRDSIDAYQSYMQNYILAVLVVFFQ